MFICMYVPALCICGRAGSAMLVVNYGFLPDPTLLQFFPVFLASFTRPFAHRHSIPAVGFVPVYGGVRVCVVV